MGAWGLCNNHCLKTYESNESKVGQCPYKDGQQAVCISELVVSRLAASPIPRLGKAKGKTFNHDPSEASKAKGQKAREVQEGLKLKNRVWGKIKDSACAASQGSVPWITKDSGYLCSPIDEIKFHAAFVEQWATLWEFRLVQKGHIKMPNALPGFSSLSSSKLALGHNVVDKEGFPLVLQSVLNRKTATKKLGEGAVTTHDISDPNPNPNPSS